MAGGNGTGPEGRGPMTGRGLGYCTGHTNPGFTRGIPMGKEYGYGRGYNRGNGRGSGYGRGNGRGSGYGRGNGRGSGYGRGNGWRRFAPAEPIQYNEPNYDHYYEPERSTKEEEIKILNANLKEIDREKTEIEKEKKDIEKRIKELEE